jgi:hypothetical protein
MFVLWKPASVLERQRHMKANVLTGAGLCAVMLLAGCSSSASATAHHNSVTPGGGCQVGAAASHTRLRLSYVEPQPKITVAVGDVIEVSAHWTSPLARPRAYPRGMVCEFNATSGKTATADFLLLRPGRVTLGTSDQVATPAMDPAFFGRVTVHSS